MLPELAQIELLAQVDELIAAARRWIDTDLPWEPLQHCHAVVRRLLARVETLRVRLESPLVVATFGGTGTGKSSLVNALVGVEVSASGRQRPTTMRPTLIAHQLTELEPLGLPLDQFSIVRCDTPLLRDIVLIDCPDPDTTEAETRGSNLERLHKLLPYCDVLIYTSTQQKYRSARVGGELSQAATGCRLVFVQTHADLDQDVREDWRQQLEEQYRVPDMFFIDSLRVLREQQAGQRPTGDFRRLEDLLSRELTASQRTQVRRANLLDLVQATLDHCRSHLAQHGPALRDLEEALEQQRRKLTNRMADRLRDELLQCGNLWERRLLDGVTETWGSSPFSTVLRVYNGLGNWIASAGLFRARTTAQMAFQTDGVKTPANRHLYGFSAVDITLQATSAALNTTFYADLVGIGGSPPDREISTINLLNAQTARLSNNQVSLREAWIKTQVFDKRLSLTLGRVDLTNYFDHNAVANDEASRFINDALVNNPVLGLTTNGLGLVAVYDPKIGLNAKLGVQQSKDDATSLSTARFVLGEVEYLARPFSLPEGHYRLWARQDNSTGTANTGYGLSIDQKITPAVTLFGRYGKGFVGAVNGRMRFVSGGIGFQAPLTFYPLDTWGIGYAHTKILTGPNANSERVAEGFYNFRLTGSLSLSVLLQYLNKPNSAENYLLPAMRLQASF